MIHKKFMDIQRIKENYAEGFHKGDYIIIQEKIDGANAAIRYDSETDSVVAQSRKNILSLSNNLRGFWEWSQTLDKELVKSVFGDNLVLFGEWLCLSGDTVIRKTSAGKNSNYMTLREMYQYRNKPCPDRVHQRLDRGRPFVFANIKDNPNISFDELFAIHNGTYKGNFAKLLNWLLKNNYVIEENNGYNVTLNGEEWYSRYVKGDSWWEKNGFPSLFSLDFKTDKIVANKMIDIVYTGDKLVYEVTTRKGFKIKSTMEHRFLTPYGFKPLYELKEKDCVAISELHNQRKKDRTYGKDTKRIFAEQKAYKEQVGRCEECGNTTRLELHHIDGNHYNNQISNYKILCSDCHRAIPINCFNGFEYDYEFDYIVSIKEVGIEDCYDIAMSGDESVANFVANGFIVHNCKHTVPYPEERYNHAYFYDVYDTSTETYLPQDEVTKIIAQLGLTYVPVFYKGEFISWEECIKYVSQTQLGGEYGEGIVVKNQTRLNDPNTRSPFYLKIVGEKFTETKGQKHVKVVDPDKLKSMEENKALAETIVTPARVEKLLNKFVDEGILPEDWGNTEMPIIAKNLTKAIYEDCVKEEPETVKKIGNFGKVANSIAMQIARGIMESR